MSDIEVRYATAADLARLMQFDLFPGDRIVEIIEKRMLVCHVRDLVIAYIAWQHKGCIGKDYVNMLVVDPPHRRRGVASALLDALGATQQGRYFISAGSSNLAAKSLLEKSSWVRAGSLTGILPDNEDQIFYFKDL